MNRPISVKIVVGLTIFFGVVLFFLFTLFGILAAVGGPYPSGTSIQLPPIFYAPLLLSIIAFAVSGGILARTKYAWHASIIFWTILTLFFVWAYTFMGVWRWMLYIESGDWYRSLKHIKNSVLTIPICLCCRLPNLLSN